MGRDSHTHLSHIGVPILSPVTRYRAYTLFYRSIPDGLALQEDRPRFSRFRRFFSTLVLVQRANGLRCLLPLRIRGVPRLVTFQTLHRCETVFEKGEMWLGSGGKDIAFIDGPRVLSRRNLPPGQESLRFHTRDYSHCTQYT